MGLDAVVRRCMVCFLYAWCIHVVFSFVVSVLMLCTHVVFLLFFCFPKRKVSKRKGDFFATAPPAKKVALRCFRGSSIIGMG